MPTETEKLIEHTVQQAPKEFNRVKRKRNLISIAILVVFALGYFLNNWLEQTMSACGSVMLQFFAIIILAIWLRESWKCPICYEIPGFIWSNPKFCSECGTKLEE